MVAIEKSYSFSSRTRSYSKTFGLQTKVKPLNRVGRSVSPAATPFRRSFRRSVPPSDTNLLDAQTVQGKIARVHVHRAFGVYPRVNFEFEKLISSHCNAGLIENPIATEQCRTRYPMRVVPHKRDQRA